MGWSNRCRAIRYISQW